MSANGDRRTPRYAGRGERVTGADVPASVVNVPAFGSWRAAQRPDVRPVDPAAPGECLCGDPADFVIETNWFSGRRSLDPVCDRHVAEVVAAITKEQARRDGG
jgi:hypothetical protein